MAAELKNYPVSEDKLRKLRAGGILPRSRALIIFALSLGLYFAINKFPYDKLKELKKVYTSTNVSSLENFKLSLGLFLELSFKGILMPMLIVFFALGLIQSKFYLNFSLLKLDFSRFFALEKYFLGYKERVLLSLSSIVFIAIILFLGFQLLGTNIEEVKKYYHTLPLDFQQAQSNVFTWLKLEESLFIFMLFVLFVVSFAARLIAIIIYRNEHAMTRGEYEAEAREGELANIMKSALKER